MLKDIQASPQIRIPAVPQPHAIKIAVLAEEEEEEMTELHPGKTEITIAAGEDEAGQ